MEITEVEFVGHMRWGGRMRDAIKSNESEIALEGQFVRVAAFGVARLIPLSQVRCLHVVEKPRKKAQEK